MSSEKMKAVLYTDGGFIKYGEMGYGGIGVHGYTFTDTPPKRGTGNPNVVPLSDGYKGLLDNKGKETVGERVTPTGYLDIVGSVTKVRSSGEVELRAMNSALEWVTTKDYLTDVKIYSDSKFVVQGLNSHLSYWSTNDWKNKSGNPIKYPELWKSVNEKYTVAKDKSKLSIEWIKGHNGNWGNESADQLATMGRNKSRSTNKETTFIKESEVEGYYKRANNAPRLLTEPRWYFNSLNPLLKDDSGFNIINCGSHGTKDKELEYVGKPYSDNYLGVVKIKDLPPIMEDLIDYVGKNKTSKYSKVIVGNLDTILSKGTSEYYDKVGINFHRQYSRTIKVIDHNNLPLISEMVPQAQGYRMNTVWEDLLDKLNKVEKESKLLRITDITDHLFELNKKGDKYQLMSKWTSRVKYFDTNVIFNFGKPTQKTSDTGLKVRLLFGKDILSRNQLAALAPDIKKLSVVTWRECDTLGRYATFIELTNGDRGIWSRYESNLVLNK